MGPKQSAASVGLQLPCYFLNQLHYIELYLHMLHVHIQLWYRCASVQEAGNMNAITQKTLEIAFNQQNGEIQHVFS